MHHVKVPVEAVEALAVDALAARLGAAPAGLQLAAEGAVPEAWCVDALRACTAGLQLGCGGRVCQPRGFEMRPTFEGRITTSSKPFLAYLPGEAPERERGGSAQGGGIRRRRTSAARTPALGPWRRTSRGSARSGLCRRRRARTQPPPPALWRSEGPSAPPPPPPPRGSSLASSRESEPAEAAHWRRAAARRLGGRSRTQRPAAEDVRAACSEASGSRAKVEGKGGQRRRRASSAVGSLCRSSENKEF